MEEEGRLTPFMIFYTEHRKSVKAQLDKVSGGTARPEEIAASLAKMWRNLGTEQTRDYCLLSNLYAESRAKHAAAGTVVNSNSNNSAGVGTAGGSGGVGGSSGGGNAAGTGTKRRFSQKGKKKKDEGLPKLPVSSFMWFSRHHRAVLKNEQQELSFCEVGKMVGALWKAATAAERRPFEDLAAEDKERYTRELTEYKAWLAHTQSQEGNAKSEGGVPPDGKKQKQEPAPPPSKQEQKAVATPRGGAVSSPASAAAPSAAPSAGGLLHGKPAGLPMHSRGV